jgi:hypothetical protein
MSKRFGMIAGFVFALIIMVFSLGQTPAYAAGGFIGDSPSCIAVQGNRVTNTCGYLVAITWCVETNQGGTCANGFTTSWDLNPGNFTSLYPPANSGISIGTLQGVACKGGFDLNGGYNATKKNVVCRSNHMHYSFPSVPSRISVPIVQAKP